MADKYNLRWAIKAAEWEPTYEEILAASSFIQKDEKERIGKFVFQDDAKSSLLGRLMLRKFVHLATSMPYEEIRFGRDNYQKPYLMGVEDTSLSFNVSHQGDFVVLAGNSIKCVGIDVMKVEPPINKDIPQFFRLMTRQFSDHEWETIKSFTTEQEQIMCFYRIWCLKESYVKNTGIGLNIALNQLSFHIQTRNLEVGKLIKDTILRKNDVVLTGWVFEETLLEDYYAVAVSLQTNDLSNHEPAPFKVLNFEELVQEAKPLFESDSVFSLNFMNKQNKSF